MTADDAIGKDLYALKNINAYKNDDITSSIVKTFKANDNMGTIYSWLQDDSGNVWWQIYDKNSNIPFYILHLQGQSSLSAPQLNQNNQNESNNTWIWITGGIVVLASISYITWRLIRKK
jgi:hypothetical protein